MNFLGSVWSVIEKNRWTVIVPALGFVLWIVAGFSCMPATESPTRLGVQVNAAELKMDYETWVSKNELTAKKFEWAAADIERQKEQWGKVQETLMSIASGSVTSWSGLLSIIMPSGMIGFFADNIRKNGVIAGLKRNNFQV